ncbi:hypothetical protein [Marinobacter fonticola]|uniref:hypothetical protein n=1 Tax=Marinobacter fonticola TaxID=2603215 RepID=UPI0011E8409D|nr:hypothetical protein [Marinobacter fonticola]
MDQSIVVHINERGEVHFLAGEARAATLLDIGGTPYAVDDLGDRVLLEKRDGRIMVIRESDIQAANQRLD